MVFKCEVFGENGSILWTIRNAPGSECARCEYLRVTVIVFWMWGSFSWGEGIKLHTMFTTWQKNDLFNHRRLMWWLAIRHLRPLRGSLYYRATVVSVTNYIEKNINLYLKPYGSWRFASRITGLELFVCCVKCGLVWKFEVLESVWLLYVVYLNVDVRGFGINGVKERFGKWAGWSKSLGV
jgi:hypothetical protein